MPYRIVPVGDKLVLMIEPELALPEVAPQAGHIQAVESNARYYDFDAKSTSANEDFRELSVGGYSHE